MPKSPVRPSILSSLSSLATDNYNCTVNHITGAHRIRSGSLPNIISSFTKENLTATANTKASGLLVCKTSPSQLHSQSSIVLSHPSPTHQHYRRMTSIIRPYHDHIAPSHLSNGIDTSASSPSSSLSSSISASTSLPAVTSSDHDDTTYASMSGSVNMSPSQVVVKSAFEASLLTDAGMLVTLAPVAGPNGSTVSSSYRMPPLDLTTASSMVRTSTGSGNGSVPSVAVSDDECDAEMQSVLADIFHHIIQTTTYNDNDEKTAHTTAHMLNGVADHTPASLHAAAIAASRSSPEHVRTSILSVISSYINERAINGKYNGASATMTHNEETPSVSSSSAALVVALPSAIDAADNKLRILVPGRGRRTAHITPHTASTVTSSAATVTSSSDVAVSSSSSSSSAPSLTVICPPPPTPPARRSRVDPVLASPRGSRSGNGSLASPRQQGISGSPLLSPRPRNGNQDMSGFVLPFAMPATFRAEAWEAREHIPTPSWRMYHHGEPLPAAPLFSAAPPTPPNSITNNNASLLSSTFTTPPDIPPAVVASSLSSGESMTALPSPTSNVRANSPSSSSSSSAIRGVTLVSKSVKTESAASSSSSSNNGNDSEPEEDPSDDILFARHARCNHEMRQDFLRYDHQKKNRKRREKEAYGRDRVTRSASHQAAIQAAIGGTDVVAVYEPDPIAVAALAAAQAANNALSATDDPPFIPQDFVMPSMSMDVKMQLRYNYDHTADVHINYDTNNGHDYTRPNPFGAYIRCVSDQDDAWGDIYEEVVAEDDSVQSQTKSGIAAASNGKGNGTRKKRTSRGLKMEDVSSSSVSPINGDHEGDDTTTTNDDGTSRKKSRGPPRTPRSTAAVTISVTTSVASGDATIAAVANGGITPRRGARDALQPISQSLDVATADGKRKRKLTIKGAGLATLHQDEAAAEAQEDAEAEADAVIRIKNGGRLGGNSIAGTPNKLARLDISSSPLATAVAGAAALSMVKSTRLSSATGMDALQSADGSRPKRSGAGRKGKLLAMGITANPLKDPIAAAAVAAANGVNKRAVLKLLGSVPLSLPLSTFHRYNQEAAAAAGSNDDDDDEHDDNDDHDDDDDFQPSTPSRKRSAANKKKSIVVIDDSDELYEASDDHTDDDDEYYYNGNGSTAAAPRYIPACDLYPRHPVEWADRQLELKRLHKCLELVRLQRSRAAAERRKAAAAGGVTSTGAVTSTKRQKSGKKSNRRRIQKIVATSTSAASGVEVAAPTNAAAIAAAAAAVAVATASVSSTSTSLSAATISSTSNGTSPVKLILSSPSSSSAAAAAAAAAVLSSSDGTKIVIRANGTSLRASTPSPQPIGITTSIVVPTIASSSTNMTHDRQAAAAAAAAAAADSYIPQWDDGPSMVVSVPSTKPMAMAVASTSQASSITAPRLSSLSALAHSMSSSSSSSMVSGTSTNGTTLYPSYVATVTSTSSTRVLPSSSIPSYPSLSSSSSNVPLVASMLSSSSPLSLSSFDSTIITLSSPLPPVPVSLP